MHASLKLHDPCLEKDIRLLVKTLCSAGRANVIVNFEHAKAILPALIMRKDGFRKFLTTADSAQILNIEIFQGFLFDGKSKSWYAILA
jgi:hypothetical protein